MNLHGIIEPAYQTPERPGFPARIRAWVIAQRVLCLVVLLPTLLTSVYLYLISSDQYVSDAHFLVSRPGQASSPGIGVSQALSLATGSSSAQSEQMSVSDYLTSHDAVATLRKEDQLVQRFQRPDVDFISKLRPANPTPEALLKYYNRQVKIKYDTETGITSLEVRSFTPKDSYDLARKLLELGEKRVNEINLRSYDDAVATAQKQLQSAEDAIATLQSRITRFRQTHADIDPKSSGEAQIQLVATLTGQLAGSRAQLTAMGQTIDHNSPQYVALAKRVRALTAQVNSLSARLTGGNATIAEDLGGFEGLKLRQDFLAKRYDAAAADLEHARTEATRQQLYVVRVVNANLPVKSTYPERMRILLTVVISALLVYAIGWLIAAGVREHAA